MNSIILLYTMNTIVHNERKAIELRRQGFSYSEIAAQLKISKTSVSNWVKNVRLTEDEKKNLERNLKSKKERTRMKISISLRAKKVYREKRAYENAERDFIKYTKDSFFAFGVGLYSARGGKHGVFQYMSSDKETIKIMLKWIEKYLEVSREKIKYRVFVDVSWKNKGVEENWAKVCRVSREKFQKTMIMRSRNTEKSPDYMGSLAILITDIEVYRRVLAWQKLMIRYYG